MKQLPLFKMETEPAVQKEPEDYFETWVVPKLKKKYSDNPLEFERELRTARRLYEQPSPEQFEREFNRTRVVAYLGIAVGAIGSHLLENALIPSEVLNQVPNLVRYALDVMVGIGVGMAAARANTELYLFDHGIEREGLEFRVTRTPSFERKVREWDEFSERLFDYSTKPVV